MPEKGSHKGVSWQWAVGRRENCGDDAPISRCCKQIGQSAGGAFLRSPRTAATWSWRLCRRICLAPCERYHTEWTASRMGRNATRQRLGVRRSSLSITHIFSSRIFKRDRLCGCHGLETKNLRPSAKSADSSFSDSLGIDLVRAIAPLHLPSTSSAPPRDPFRMRSREEEEEESADFADSRRFGEAPFLSSASSATSLGSKSGCRICG